MGRPARRHPINTPPLRSAVKYNPSATGYATTVALFLSFWSSWSLLNVYLTKFAADDVLHRFFLAFHVVSSYVAATFLSHVDYEFFDFNHQATYFATATIVNRLGLVGVWAHVAARAVPPSTGGRSVSRLSQIVRESKDRAESIVKTTAIAKVIAAEPGWIETTTESCTSEDSTATTKTSIIDQRPMNSTSS